MPAATMTRVELMCLQGLADLEQLEGPWLDGMVTGDPEFRTLNRCQRGPNSQIVVNALSTRWIQPPKAVAKIKLAAMVQGE